MADLSDFYVICATDAERTAAIEKLAKRGYKVNGTLSFWKSAPNILVCVPDKEYRTWAMGTKGIPNISASQFLNV